MEARPPPDLGAALGTRVLHGFGWAYGSYVGGRMLVLIATAILARLLSPTEFGLVALALIVTGILDRLSDVGVSQALVVIEDETLERASTAWTFTVLMGLILTLLCVALAPVAAAVFDEPELVGLLSVLGLNFVVRGAGLTHYALAQKRLDFRTRTIAELADVVVRGVAGIGLALAGAGAWSLVAGYLAGSASATATLWATARWHPRIVIDRRHLGPMLRFGGGVTLLDVLSVIVNNADYALIGAVLGSHALGLYTLGFRLPELIVLNGSVIAGIVLFPAFAKLDARDLRRVVLASLRLTIMLAVPLTTVLVLLASPVVATLFGDQWTDSAGVMRLLAIYALFETLAFPGGTAYKATGRVDLLLKLAVPYALLAPLALALVVDRGILAVAACQAVLAGLFATATVTLSMRVFGLRLRDLWRAVWPSGLAASGMALIILACLELVSGAWAQLVAGVVAGVSTYLVVLVVVDREAMRKLVVTARGAMGNRVAGGRAAD